MQLLCHEVQASKQLPMHLSLVFAKELAFGHGTFDGIGEGASNIFSMEFEREFFTALSNI